MSPDRIEDHPEAGFTLIEIVCVIALVGLLAAIVLPRLPAATSRARLEAYATEVAALLKADRNAALWRHRTIASAIDAENRIISSGAGNMTVRVPDDVEIEALLPQRCNGRLAASSVQFFANGMSCGGTISLARPGATLEIRVNWLTGGIEIVSRDAL